MFQLLKLENFICVQNVSNLKEAMPLINIIGVKNANLSMKKYNDELK